jgi:hypothetical protein
MSAQTVLKAALGDYPQKLISRAFKVEELSDETTRTLGGQIKSWKSLSTLPGRNAYPVYKRTGFGRLSWQGRQAREVINEL